MLKYKILAFFFYISFLDLSTPAFSKENSKKNSSPCNQSKDWKRVYLASFPQSGNHWARYMIEEASGIVTSSVYCDLEPPGHMNQIFPWGGYCCNHGYAGNCRYPTKKDRVLVKTHFPYPHKDSPFDHRPHEHTLLIVRNPIDSIYSRHVKVPQGPIKNKIPPEQLKRWVENWRKFHDYWNKQTDVTMIRYEDMLENPSLALKKMCKVLKYSVTDQDVERAVSKNPPEGFMYKHIGHFRKKDLSYISKELKDLLEKYDYQIPQSVN